MEFLGKLMNRSKEELEAAMEHFDHEVELTRAHCGLVHFNHMVPFAPDSYRSIDDQKYVEPTPDEIKFVIEHLAKAHSKAVVSKMLGLKTSNDPTRVINRWMKGEAKIPYAAWRLLLILDGRVVQVNRLPDPNGVKSWEKYYK